jgi:hypothetical protein
VLPRESEDEPRIELVDAGEIARRLHLRHRNVVLDWRLHRLNFPAPVARRRTYLWRWSDVEAWFAKNESSLLGRPDHRRRPQGQESPE